MKLRVIAGAKEGVEVPLKKSKFVIGRASDCTLRAGSDAISRHHCMVMRSETGEVTVRDLGSRNGTLVNGVKIDAETPLGDGDELQVGPLRFVAFAEADLKRDKMPAVKSVAAAVERASKKTADAAEDDDISRWLLGPEPATGVPASMKETQTLRMDETQAIGRPGEATQPAPGSLGEEASDDASAGDGAGGETVDADSLATSEELEPSAGKKGKTKPGKLPPLPAKPQARDSREAAADILREMARRR